MSNHTVAKHYAERSAGVYEHTTTADRLDRAVDALRFTARNTPHPWLRQLAVSKYWEAASAQKLRSCGYRVRFDRTDPRSVR